MKRKANVHIIATGGTIAGRAASAAATVGYKAGELTVGQLIASVPGLDKLANLSGEQLCNIDSKDMQEAIWLQLAERVEAAAERKDVDGIVITHGTDTLEETAYFLQLTVKTDKPIVLTGAMRPATAISADGPMNIWQSVQVAADASATGRGVLVVMNGQINGAETVTKVNVNALEAFQSPGRGPLGVIIDEKICWNERGAVCPIYINQRIGSACESATDVLPAQPAGEPTQSVPEGTAGENRACALPNRIGSVSVKNLTQLPKVRIIYGCVGGDDGVFVKAALRDGARGLVYAACGNGSVPEKLTGLLKETVASGVPVVIATRCGGGIVVLAEEMTEINGFIAAGPLNPQKAKILLQLALTKTNGVKELQRLFAKRAE